MPRQQQRLRVRRHPATGYGVAVALVAAATLLRWAIRDEIAEGLPFITYYPAIVVAALVGGLWPGILATVSSVAIAWYLFLLPASGFEIDRQQIATLLLFVFLSGFADVTTEAAYELGAQGRFYKPVTMSTLAEAIKVIISKSKA